MTVATESVEDILRPPAEATVRQLIVPDTLVALPKPSGDGLAEALASPPLVNSKLILDPRFDALRLRCPMLSGGFFPWSQEHGRIDASLRAIVRAILANGYYISIWFDPNPMPNTGHYGCEVHEGFFDGNRAYKRYGESTEEAAARAFVAAWKGKKP